MILPKLTLFDLDGTLVDSALAFQQNLKPIDGAVDLVRSVRSQVCIASNGPPEKIRLSLSLTGLQPFFGDRLFSAYDVQAWKPDPELFLSDARTLGVHPRDCAVVEDSLPGIHGGLAAGMQVFAYFPDSDPPPLPDAVVVVKHLSELQTHL